MSIRKSLKNEMDLGKAPWDKAKTALSTVKRDLIHKPPGEDPSVTQARIDQMQQLADLNDQENYKRKALLNSAGGLRVYRGSAADRAATAPAASVGGVNSGGNPGGIPGRAFINSGRVSGGLL